MNVQAQFEIFQQQLKEQDNVVGKKELYYANLGHCCQKYGRAYI